MLGAPSDGVMARTKEMSPLATSAGTGAWERKRARARVSIQRAAFRLFREQGFAATTVEQVAEQADVAPSTVFRYFPTKQDLLVFDPAYSLLRPLSEAFEAMPPELTPLQALRGAVREALAQLSPEAREIRYERDLLMLTVPELWSANFGLLGEGIDAIAELVARRVGRPNDDPRVRAFARAASGAGIGVLIAWSRAPGDEDPIEAIDAAFAALEDGLTL
ncbi:TetR family transcriptional regulator [Spiractinospora alimapuensis]|uniref:TetR/AcrR family transcriptional regulator n=1 Tax=Spiractinospora alimapuensis TaxID=2820884 RepID=UPI001F1C2A31|nr:TetR family transcriptional regulator [Spiractinospora alimapuensis]QVQ51182.1 TetR family transcriptional regulator [Spiractinospora alimapuensis]